MSFSDDDLKRLKEQADEAVERRWNYPHWIKIQALLARLEDAERCAQKWCDLLPQNKDSIYAKAWRKECGKDGGKEG